MTSKVETPTSDEVEAPPFALYSLGQIRWTAFLGGPLVATLMLSSNFKKLGFAERAKWTRYIGGGTLSALQTSLLVDGEGHLTRR